MAALPPRSVGACTSFLKSVATAVSSLVSSFVPFLFVLVPPVSTALNSGLPLSSLFLSQEPSSSLSTDKVGLSGVESCGDDDDDDDGRAETADQQGEKATKPQNRARGTFMLKGTTQVLPAKKKQLLRISDHMMAATQHPTTGLDNYITHRENENE